MTLPYVAVFFTLGKRHESLPDMYANHFNFTLCRFQGGALFVLSNVGVVER
jgi:hypothetical protein